MQKDCKNQILELIQSNLHSVNDLAEIVGVSKTTIRKKLKELETECKNIKKEKQGKKYLYSYQPNLKIVPEKPKEAKGLLYFNFCILNSEIESLEYLDLKTKNSFNMKTKDKFTLTTSPLFSFPMISFVKSIYNDGKEVYLGGIPDEDGAEIISLLANNYIQLGLKPYQGNSIIYRNNSIYSIIKHNGKIIDSGIYGLGLYDTIENKILISKEDMNKKKIIYIESLIKDNQNRLFGLCVDYKKNSTLRELTDYSIGDVILDYKTKHITQYQAKILPYGGFKGENGKDYDFSVLSCVNLKYLDLNGDKIEGSECEENKDYEHKAEILSLDYLKLEGKEIDVVYSGLSNWETTMDDFQIKNNDIYQAKIDLEKKRVLEKKVLVSNLGTHVTSLNVVRNQDLHENLIKYCQPKPKKNLRKLYK